jgi:multiple sugar transport system permease protein
MSSVSAPAPPAQAPKVALGSKRTEGVGRLATLLLAPTFLVLGLVVLYPILAAFRLAFYRKNEGVDPETGRLVEGDQFVGLDNFAAMFSGATGDQFRNAMFNTTFFMVTTVILETVIGVAMALVMHKAFRGRALIRASILVPWAMPTAISGLMWNFAFQADGVVNSVLPGDPVLWTLDAWQAKITIIVADTWKTAPFIGLLVLAGLQVISNEVYEAAKVDGASPWRTFWHVTLPLVKPALVVAVLFRLLDVLRMFDLPWTLIGPGKREVETVSMLSFQQAQQFGNYGIASAYALALFLYICVIAFVFVKLLGADVIGERAGRK